MTITRRAFVKKMGITIATLAMTRCSPTAGKSETPRDHLRDCWLRLDGLAQETRDNWSDFEQGEQIKQQLISEHRAALDELIAAGELDAAVAGQMQSAFDAAAYHVWRSNAPITCYEAMLLDYKPVSSSQLVQQAEMLAEMAESGNLDPNTVAQAQAAVEQDIAFLSLSQAETQALYDALIEAGGDSYDFPSLDELELEVSAETVAAARFLVELLLEE
jgi:hypothetical protein